MSAPNLLSDRGREAPPPSGSRIDSIRRRLSTFHRRLSVDEKQLETAGVRPTNRSKDDSQQTKSRESWYSNNGQSPMDKSLTYNNDTKNSSNVVVSEYGNNGYDQEVTIWRDDEGNDLTEWASKVNETMANMEALRQSFGSLQVKFGEHLHDLGLVEENKNRLAFLEQQCKEKDDQIQRQLATISTLTKISFDQEEKIAKERVKIEGKQKDLDREKIESERKTDVRIAREKKNQQEEFEKIIASHNLNHEDRRRQMEDDFRRQKEEGNRRITALDAENKQLSRTLQEQSQRIRSQEVRFKRSVQRIDALQQYIQSYKKQLEGKEKELGMVKSAFTSRFRSLDDLKTQFTKISSFVEEISMKYFTDPIEKDPGSAHEDLVAADAAFTNVPIDESEVSYNLRIAHVQRVISEALCEYIWKPFRSDYTLAHDDFTNFLLQMMNALDNSNLAGQPANIWTALTMRALELLPGGPIQHLASPTPSGRAKNVISKVYSVLSPLLSRSKSRSFAADLGTLTDLAIDVWQTAYTSDYRVQIIPQLDPVKYQEWRSQAFDPTTMQGTNAMPSEIFLLFPRVEATVLSGQTPNSVNPLASAPKDFDRIPITEACLHPGKGLPHSSELVLHGVQIQEDINNYIENAKREARMKRYSGTNNSRKTSSNPVPKISHSGKHYEQAALAS